MMLNIYKTIDETTWKRALHCKVFRNNIEPSYCVTFELDITSFLKKIKTLGYSFTMSLIYLSSRCANDIEEFRYRFFNDQVVLFEKIDTAFTYLDKDTELFKVVNVKLEDSLEKYVSSASQKAKSQSEYFTGPLGVDVFQFSPIPWIPYTHISHTISGKKDNSTPLFNWGKYREEKDRYILPFSVQVHHSLVDGLHVGRFYDSLQESLNSL